jgi:hypothetical protein
VRDLDNHVAAAEEHQPAPIRMRAIKRHVEAEPGAIEGGGPFGSDVETTTWSIAVIAPAAVCADSGRSLPLQEKQRTPRVVSGCGPGALP